MQAQTERENFVEKLGRAVRAGKNGKNRKDLVINIAVSVVSALLLLVGGVCFYGEYMLSQVRYAEDPPAVSQQSRDPSQAESSAGAEISQPVVSDWLQGDATLVNGLYHDDAIMNILVIGVDNYQANDVGRSDSMILVSVDTRHQKLKLTSIMRDLYVQIPGYGSNRINSAYSLGGPTLTVQTIESNFGVDIDRWVIVDFDAFTHTIDKIGGVTITVSDAEADLINQHSGESWENALPGGGTYRLTGLQARYYSRIRAIGDDFERTQRQRNVISSLVEEFKSADLGSINNAIYSALGEITTSISKNEILQLAANSLTYLNYPIEQNRLPIDGGYTNERVMLGGSVAQVLLPDLRLNSEEIIRFIYTDGGDASSEPAA